MTQNVNTPTPSHHFTPAIEITSSLGRVIEVTLTVPLHAGSTDDPTYDTSEPSIGPTALMEAGPGSGYIVPPIAGNALMARRGGSGDSGGDWVCSPAVWTRKPITGDHPGDVGLLTHVLIQTAITCIRGDGAVDLLRWLEALAMSAIRATTNRRWATATQAVALAHQYLTLLAPDPSWTLLDIEADSGDGPVDVAWIQPATGQVFFDEIKTSRGGHRNLPVAWIAQCARYAKAGAEGFGDAFAGVRLMPLNAPRLTSLVTPDGRCSRISPTASEPFGGLR
jgi:hypothetical protein